MTSNDMVFAILGAVAFLVGMLICLKRGGKNRKSRAGSSSIFQMSRKKRELEAKLLNMVFGDKNTATRLINYERNRNPTGSEEDLILSAIERLKYDRR